MDFHKKTTPKYLTLTFIFCSLILNRSVFADFVPCESKKSVIKKPVIKKPKVKALTSPAHRFALQKPILFAQLLSKDKATLKAGRVQTFIESRKNEHGKNMLVVYTRMIIQIPQRTVYNIIHRKLKRVYRKTTMNFSFRLHPHRRFQFNYMRRSKNRIIDSIGAYNFEKIEGGKHTFVSHFMYSDSDRRTPGFIRKPLSRRGFPEAFRTLQKRNVNGRTLKKK